MNNTTYTQSSGLVIRRYVMPGIESNMFLIVENEATLIVDPNEDADALSYLTECDVRNCLVLVTHEHYDHISGINRLREHFSTEVIATETAGKALENPAENMAKFWDIMLMDLPLERMKAGMEVMDKDYACHADRVFTDHLTLTWNGHSIELQAAPGHSKGGMLITMEDVLFSGDNLVNGNGVICRFPGGRWKTYCEVTTPLLDALSDDMLVCPGHGEPARLGDIRKYMNKYGSV